MSLKSQFNLTYGSGGDIEIVDNGQQAIAYVTLGYIQV